MAIAARKSDLIELLAAEGTSEDFSFEGLEFDSRKIKGGELFVALPGENTHGHQFASQAYDRGCALLLVEDSKFLTEFPEPGRIIVVKDSLKSFQKIAAWWREKLNLPTLAVTGSVGKTTAKELMAAILLQHSVGNYARSSLNNHVGVPYTICQSSPKHKWQVLEMGMNHRGEIEILSNIGKPDVAVVLKIGAAHIGNLGSMEAIAEAKLEITAGLSSSGTLILNADDELLMRTFSRNFESHSFKVKTFGKVEDAELRLTGVSINEALQLEVKLKDGGVEKKMQTKILGLHNAYNIAAAVLACRTLIPDLSWEQVQAGLKAYLAPEGRLKVRQLAAQRVLIDDSYNANPTSMSGMLKIAAELVKQGGRVGLLLGDMRELGELSRAYHDALIPEILEVQPAFVVLCGEEISPIASELKQAGLAVTTVESPESAAHLVHKLEFNYLLVKASHGIALERTVQKLIEIEGEIIVPQQLTEKEEQ